LPFFFSLSKCLLNRFSAQGTGGSWDTSRLNGLLAAVVLTGPAPHLKL
jgi:hypothetical protein